MHYTLKLEQFEGPLELLLTLIEDEKLDITTISLAKVTDQYLAYLERQEESPPNEVADFLVVAAKLIYIKSKYLLPSLELQEDDGQDLEQQLKIYREYYNASKVVLKMISKKRFAFVREGILRLKIQSEFYPPPNVTLDSLRVSFLGVIGKLETIIKLPKIILKNTVSIKEKICILKNAIRNGILHFNETLDKTNKQDTIVSFLALLELVKMRYVAVNQIELFSEIVVTKGSAYE